MPYSAAFSRVIPHLTVAVVLQPTCSTRSIETSLTSCRFAGPGITSDRGTQTGEQPFFAAPTAAPWAVGHRHQVATFIVSPGEHEELETSRRLPPLQYDQRAQPVGVNVMRSEATWPFGSS